MKNLNKKRGILELIPPSHRIPALGLFVLESIFGVIAYRQDDAAIIITLIIVSFLTLVAFVWLTKAKEQESFISEGEDKQNIELNRNLKGNHCTLIKSTDEFYNTISNPNGTSTGEIHISSQNLKWVYCLFPTLIRWSMEGYKVSVYYSFSNYDKKTSHEKYQSRLLACMGVQFVEHDEVRDYIIFNPNDENKSKAVIKITSQADELSNLRSVHYCSNIHYEVIKEFFASLNKGKEVSSPMECVTATLIKNEDYIKILQNIPEYKNAEISIEKIILNKKKKDIVFITKYIRSYKYEQIESLISLYKKENIELFKPINIEFGEHKSPTGIPILEYRDNKYYIIDGNTRFLYCFEKDLHEIYVAVIKGVKLDFPSSGRYNIDEVSVNSEGKEGETRYDKFEYSLFRSIEFSIRPPDSSLLDINVRGTK